MACVARRVINRLRRDQSGFTLVELLIGSTLALVIAFAAMNFSQIATGSHDRTADRAEALGAARVGLERMTRELRQASYVNATGGVVDLQTHSLQTGVTVNVRYDCTEAAECRRYQYPVGGTLPSAHQVVISGVGTASFTVETNADTADYVRTDLMVEVPDHAPVALSDGVHLHNQQDG